jgi:hypothetical protein
VRLQVSEERSLVNLQGCQLLALTCIKSGNPPTTKNKTKKNLFRNRRVSAEWIQKDEAQPNQWFGAQID